MYLLRNMTLKLAFLSLKKALFTNQFLRHRSLDENGADSTELYCTLFKISNLPKLILARFNQ